MTVWSTNSAFSKAIGAALIARPPRVAALGSVDDSVSTERAHSGEQFAVSGADLTATLTISTSLRDKVSIVAALLREVEHPVATVTGLSRDLLAAQVTDLAGLRSIGT